MTLDSGNDQGLSRHILVIDDDSTLRKTIRTRLEIAGHRVTLASDAQEGIHKTIATRFDVILLDLMMPGLSGDELLRAIRPLGLKTKVVVMSGSTDPRWQEKVRDLGAVAVLEKPFPLVDLPGIIAGVTSTSVEEREEEKKKGGAFRDVFWNMVLSFVFSEPQPTGYQKGVGLALIAGLALMILWTFFGKMI